MNINYNVNKVNNKIVPNKNLINKSNSNDFLKTFNEIKADKELSFSKHANKRLQDRNIELNEKEINQINNALNKAKSKGIKESLIIMGDKRFIANVDSKTIITATENKSEKESIYTNIDGAVII